MGDGGDWPAGGPVRAARVPIGAPVDVVRDAAGNVAAAGLAPDCLGDDPPDAGAAGLPDATPEPQPVAARAARTSMATRGARAGRTWVTGGE